MSKGIQKFTPVSLDGVQEMRLAMVAAGDDLQDFVDTHRRVAEIVTEEVWKKIPIDSGDLQASIRPGATATSATVRAGNRLVPYACCVHWGRQEWPSKTAVPKPPRKRHHNFVYPRYYITKPAAGTEPVWIKEYQKRVSKIVDKTMEEAHPK